MSSVLKIGFRVLEQQRAEESRRKAAIDAALAKAPPPRVTKENWTDWNKYGWHGCPGDRRRTCSDPACGVSATCKRMAELGLAGDGTHHSAAKTDLTAVPGPARAPHVWLGSLPFSRRTLNRPKDRRGQGADRSGAAHAMGQVASPYCRHLLKLLPIRSRRVMSPWNYARARRPRNLQLMFYAKWFAIQCHSGTKERGHSSQNIARNRQGSFTYLSHLYSNSR